MPASEIPEPWNQAMVAANIGNPRNGVPSIRALAERANLSPETVRRMISGHSKDQPQDASVRAVAAALRVDVRVVAAWAGQARAVQGAYEPPAEAGLLSQREREAVSEIIRLLAAGKSVGSITPITRAVDDGDGQQIAAYQGDHDDESRI